MKIGKVLKIKEILDDNSFILIYLKDDDITICVDNQGFSFTDKNLIIDGELTKIRKYLAIQVQIKLSHTILNLLNLKIIQNL